MKKFKIWFNTHLDYIGGFCLGFSLTGIYGLLDGVLLSIAIICFLEYYKR